MNIYLSFACFFDMQKRFNTIQKHLNNEVGYLFLDKETKPDCSDAFKKDISYREVIKIKVNSKEDAIFVINFYLNNKGKGEQPQLYKNGIYYEDKMIENIINNFNIQSKKAKNYKKASEYYQNYY